MAYIAKTAFEPRIVYNRTLDLCNIAGRYQESAADADCSAGLICVRNGRTPCAGFTGVYNENTWYMNAAPATVNCDDVLYAANTYENKRVEGYRIGRGTLGLGIPEGEDGTFTRIYVDGESEYRFGEGNVSGTVGSNKYFTIENGLLKTAAAKPTDTGAVYAELAGTGKFIEGNRESFGYYDVVFHKVSTVAGE